MDLKKKETKEWHANHGGKYTNFEEKYRQKGGPRKASWMEKKKNSCFENTVSEVAPTDNAHSQKFYHMRALQSTRQR